LVWMETSESGRPVKVGLSVSNVLAPDSDSELVHIFLLTRVDRILKSPKHGRETMSEFVQDWSALKFASENHATTLARNAAPEKRLGRAPRIEVGNDCHPAVTPSIAFVGK